MLYRANPVVILLLGASKIFLCIIVVNRATECVVNKLIDFRDGAKVNFMSRVVFMVRLFHTVIYTNPNQKVIHPHIYGITGLVHYNVCDLIIDLDVTFLGVLLWLIFSSSSVVSFVLAHDP